MPYSHGRAALSVSVFATLVSLVACTSNNSTSQPPQSSPPLQSTTHAFNGGAIAGFHANSTKKTTSRRFSLLPPVYAQTTSTITLTGAYSGYTPNFGGAESQGQGIAIPQGSVPIAYPIFGVGTLSPNCAPGGSSLNCTFAAGAGSVSAGQALASQVSPSNAIQGKLAPAFVAGAGTIGPMVAFGYAFNGTISQGSPATSDLVEVWVIRNGQVMSTGVSCGLPVQANPSTIQTQRCESSATFNVQDSDGIVATVTLNPADELAAMNFFLIKN